MDPTKEEMLDEIGSLKKKMLAILNKLTVHNLPILAGQFNALPIDSETKLQVCMALIFDRVVEDSYLSEVCAMMCQVLKLKTVLRNYSKTETVKFRQLLISRCQKEFEKNYMESLDRDKYWQDMAVASTEEERKQVKAVFELMETQLRRRWLGNIKFVGELYKLKMLSARIMHECVKKLLRTIDNESLEALCSLLTSVGRDLEYATQVALAHVSGMNNFEVYFKEITQDKTVCSRVRFLMLNVIELRIAGWKVRRKVGETIKDTLKLKEAEYELDQETWLCRTHLDDFKVKI